METWEEQFVESQIFINIKSNAENEFFQVFPMVFQHFPKSWPIDKGNRDMPNANTGNISISRNYRNIHVTRVA